MNKKCFELVHTKRVRWYNKMHIHDVNYPQVYETPNSKNKIYIYISVTTGVYKTCTWIYDILVLLVSVVLTVFCGIAWLWLKAELCIVVCVSRALKNIFHWGLVISSWRVSFSSIGPKVNIMVLLVKILQRAGHLNICPDVGDKQLKLVFIVSINAQLAPLLYSPRYKSFSILFNYYILLVWLTGFMCKKFPNYSTWYQIVWASLLILFKLCFLL